MSEDTASQSWAEGGSLEVLPLPGVLLVHAGARPVMAPLPLQSGRLLLGRDAFAGLQVEDPCLSRRHAEITTSTGGFRVRDLGSRNGTFLDGKRLTGSQVATAGRVVRIGDTLLILCHDVKRYRRASVELEDGLVIGPALREAWNTIARAAEEGQCLHIRGETGTGKELAAREFNRASRKRKGPFIAVNCATIPEAIAERLLFGTQRGAYSGASTDATGYFQAADGGTLFLDEVAELNLDVQAKLLRVIESSEVMPLGATRPTRIDVRFCSATHSDLARDAEAGRFRPDLYYRIGQNPVTLPPLRERREEIPWLALAAAGKRQLALHASIVEAALVRPWPGNVRELLGALTLATGRAADSGAAQLRATHLPKGSGLALPAQAAATAAAGPPDDATIEAALRRTKIVAQAARELGMHRTQLHRWLARHPEVAAFIRS
jgi:transcriptional regulator with PAS, ATPase and Fis domain